MVHIYGNMGGEVQAKASKAQHHHADMDEVVSMMSEYGMSEADMVEASGLSADRVKALMHEGAKPTADEIAAMTDACDDCADEGEDMDKHGDHDQSTHGGGGGAKPGSRAGRGSLARAGKAFDRMRDSMAMVFESDNAGTRDDAKAVMMAVKEGREAMGDGDNEKYHSKLNQALTRAITAAGTAKTSRDEKNLRAAARHIETQIRNVRKTFSDATLLKASLGMSDGEFRRLLAQAVYARWGKQAAVDEVFPDTMVAVVRLWDGEPWLSSHRLMQVPYDTEGGVVTLGEVAGEVRQTYEPVAKSVQKTASVEYLADLDERTGEYVVAGLNGDAELLAKSLADAGCKARVDAQGDENRVVFSRDGVTCRKRQLAIRCEAEGEFDATETQGFVPYLRDEFMIRKAEEKGIVYAVVYEPDVVDKQGEWATADDIEEAAHDYLKRSRRMKRQHDEHSDSEVVESYIAQCDFLLGNRVVRKGSWVIAEKLGEKSKKLYKEGKLGGVSMGGNCEYAKE